LAGWVKSVTSACPRTVAQKEKAETPSLLVCYQTSAGARDQLLTQPRKPRSARFGLPLANAVTMLTVMATRFASQRTLSQQTHSLEHAQKTIKVEVEVLQKSLATTTQIVKMKKTHHFVQSKAEEGNVFYAS